MVRHGGSSAGSYLADPTSPIPSQCASIVVTSTLRANIDTEYMDFCAHFSATNYCYASGDPHYNTWDRWMIHFMGTCAYTLVEPNPDSYLDTPHFEVIVSTFLHSRHVGFQSLCTEPFHKYFSSIITTNNNR